jgi:F-type H+-transporting ATPase subunit gamma
MPSTRDLRRRIKSIRNTSQITKAMQMVAAAKMRKAQTAALTGRPYTDLLNQMLGNLQNDVSEFSHPLMEERPVKKSALLIVSTDKGLCGPLNTNLLREVLPYDRDNTIFLAAGRKGAQFLHRTRRNLKAEFTFKDSPDFVEARGISRFLQDSFLSGEVDKVEVLYTNFVSTIRQEPKVRQLLPILELEKLDPDLVDKASEADGTDSPSSGQDGTEFLYEPDAAGVLGSLLPHYLNYVVFQVLLEAKASEHSSRMVAMKNATDNAKQLIKDLTLEYNKVRQAAITSELLEITTAAMAMEN